jgi:hypothetical protein
LYTPEKLILDYKATYQKAKKELADKRDAAAYREAIAHMVVDSLPSEYYQVAKKYMKSNRPTKALEEVVALWVINNDLEGEQKELADFYL